MTNHMSWRCQRRPSNNHDNIIHNSSSTTHLGGFGLQLGAILPHVANVTTIKTCARLPMFVTVIMPRPAKKSAKLRGTFAPHISAAIKAADAAVPAIAEAAITSRPSARTGIRAAKPCCLWGRIILPDLGRRTDVQVGLAIRG